MKRFFINIISLSILLAVTFMITGMADASDVTFKTSSNTLGYDDSVSYSANNEVSGFYFINVDLWGPFYG